MFNCYLFGLFRRARTTVLLKTKQIDRYVCWGVLISYDYLATWLLGHTQKNEMTASDNDTSIETFQQQTNKRANHWQSFGGLALGGSIVLPRKTAPGVNVFVFVKPQDSKP